MNKGTLRVKNKKLYVIEVNDNGETISFDLNDPSLKIRLLKAYDKIKSISAEYQKEVDEISKREDVQVDELTTKNQRDMFDLEYRIYMKMREIMDMFLGKGACQKIFGDLNWPEMWDELFESLMPEFEKMGIDITDFKNVQKDMADKYRNENEEIEVL